MEIDRENYINVFVGDRGTGKTPVVIGDLQYNVPSLAKIYLNKGSSVFVVDTFDHMKYRPFVTNVPPGTDLSKLPLGFYRIIGSNFEMISAAINEQVWNALVVFEDSFKYIKRKLSDETIATLIDSKQKNIESIFMYHAWGFICPDLLRIADVFEIFKSEEHPAVRKKELAGCYDRIEATYNRVMKNKSNFYHETVIR